MEHTLFRKARAADLPRIAEIIRQAQAQMRALGSDQWQDGYPAPSDIARDIAAGDGYVLCRAAAEPAEGGAKRCGTTAASSEEVPATTEVPAEDGAREGAIIAYGAAAFDGEVAYDALREGRWLTDRPYVVLHRLAVADEAKRCGVARRFMQRVEELARERGVGSFRVDTNFDNGYMLRLIERQGFVYCGKVRYRSGERLAFEKVLDGSAGR